jgi:hypothetical protein
MIRDAALEGTDDQNKDSDTESDPDHVSVLMTHLSFTFRHLSQIKIMLVFYDSSFIHIQTLSLIKIM